MTGQGWVTGDIRTQPSTKEYREGWERIFGTKKITENMELQRVCEKSPYLDCTNGDRPQD